MDTLKERRAKAMINSIKEQDKAIRDFVNPEAEAAIKAIVEWDGVTPIDCKRVNQLTWAGELRLTAYDLDNECLDRLRELGTKAGYEVVRRDDIMAFIVPEVKKFMEEFKLKRGY